MVLKFQLHVFDLVVIVDIKAELLRCEGMRLENDWQWESVRQDVCSSWPTAEDSS